MPKPIINNSQKTLSKNPPFINLFFTYAMSIIVGVIFSTVAILAYWGILLFWSLFTTGGVFSSFGFAFSTTWSHLYYIVGAVVAVSMTINFFVGRSVMRAYEGFSPVKERLGFSDIEPEKVNAGVSRLFQHPSENKILFLPKGEIEAADGCYFVIDKGNLIDSELYVDDLLVSRATSGVGGSLAGAAIGGVLTGGTGAIIGAIAGKNNRSISEIRIRKVAINLTLRDKKKPFQEIVFYTTHNKEDKGLNKNDWPLEYHLERANHWQAVFRNMAEE